MNSLNLNLKEDDVVKTILDRTKDVDPLIEEVLGYWEFDFLSRKPGSAYQDGKFIGTDLDLCCFLFSLIKRNPVIKIPGYKARRQKQVKEGQVKVGNERFGQLIGLGFDQDTFSSFVRIYDMSVTTTEHVGDFRNYTITDFDGSWYSGWNKMTFIPTSEENKIICESGILSGDSMLFKHFVHPNRWVSIFGKPYIRTKLLLNRLTEQGKFVYTDIQRMIAESIKYPSSGKKAENTENEKKSVGETRKIIVPAFNVVLEHPDFIGEYTRSEKSQENLVKLTDWRKKLVYHTIPALKFMVRSMELAYKTHADSHGYNSFPPSIKNIQWEKGYVPQGKRTEYDKLMLSDGYSLLIREWNKKETVDFDYDSEAKGFKEV